MSYIVPQKMPLRCFECGHISISTIEGYGCKITHKSLESEHGRNLRRPDWCPLVEIPTPHGRLGDLDKLKADYSMKDDCAECEKELRYSSRSCEYDRIYSKMDFCGWLDDAEVVIEAEGET